MLKLTRSYIVINAERRVDLLDANLHPHECTRVIDRLPAGAVLWQEIAQ
jgi:hypothetical protein